MLYHVALSPCFPQDPRTALSTKQTECRGRVFPYCLVLALSLQSNMWPTTSFNAQRPTPIWKVIIAIFMDTASNHATKNHLNFKRHHWEDIHCLILQCLVRHRDFSWCPSSLQLQHQELKADRAIWGSWVRWKPYRGEEVWGGFWNMYSGSGSCSSKEGFKQDCTDGKTWLWASVQTSQCAFRWCLLLICRKSLILSANCPLLIAIWRGDRWTVNMAIHSHCVI